jgi:hypothetical protein
MLSNKEIARELKAAILYRDGNEGAVKAMAKALDLSRRTIYAYLDGEIKINLRFLHAAIAATNGDPDIKKFLEPEGWELTPKRRVGNKETFNFEKEIGDIHITASRLHGCIREALSDGLIDGNELNQIIKRADDMRRELDEVLFVARKSEQNRQHSVEAQIRAHEPVTASPRR